MDAAEARLLLETWRQEAEGVQTELDEIHDELPEVIDTCVKIGLQKKEIAKLSGLSRTTIHRYIREVRDDSKRSTGKGT